MPNVQVADAAPKRFPEDFEVTAANNSPDDTRYATVVSQVIDDLAEDEKRDASSVNGSDPVPALVLARRKRRAAAAAALRAEAQEVSQGSLISTIAADNALVIKGEYVADRDRLTKSLFVVEESIKEGLANELLIAVAGDQPPPSEQQQALFVALGSAFTVVKAVCQRMDDRAQGWLKTKRRRGRERLRSQRLLDQYVRKLAGIGRIGLMGRQTQLATLALDGLRKEFVAQEAARIKNSYLRSLGIAAGVGALLFLACS
jgi:hypothetical protein